LPIFRLGPWVLSQGHGTEKTTTMSNLIADDSRQISEMFNLGADQVEDR